MVEPLRERLERFNDDRMANLLLRLLIVLLLSWVIAVTADLLVGQHGDAPWRRGGSLNLVADFIASLP